MKKLLSFVCRIAWVYIVFHGIYTVFMFTQSTFYGCIWLAITMLELIIVYVSNRWHKGWMVLLTVVLVLQTGLSLGIYCKGLDEDVEHADYVLVLGYALDDNQMTETLEMRLQTTYEYALRNPNSQFILCGGLTGNNSVTEAEVMYAYLVEKGIAEDRLLLENQSTDTIENIRNSKAYINENAKILVISSNYHVYRASVICDKVGLEVYTLGSDAPLLLLPNQYLHEKLGFVKLMLLM